MRTVEVHRSRMMDRLGVHQLGQAVRLSVLASLAEAR
ncbi:LuxR C-terminal-related transcriptional regulator [Mesorhizobium jarvisii]